MSAVNNSEMLELALKAITGAIITDAADKIVYIHDSYAKILKINAAEIVGTPVKDVIPGTRMHIVRSTGKEELGFLFRLKNGEKVFINSMPIKKDNTIVGAIAFSTLSRREDVNTFATIKEVKRLIQEVNRDRCELSKLRGARYSLDQIVGYSPSIVNVKKFVEKIAQTKSTVLITGETGTGKELIANAIHQSGPRSHHPFVKINCAAIPSELLETELFGYAEGTFTGALRNGKLGKFESANGGTLLLDDINQMPLHLQAKLLRVIQEKEVERVGSTKSIDLDVRLVCTTNEDIFRLVNKGNFRADLYYRINVVNVDIPPLRTRTEDIPALAKFLIAKINRELGLHISGISDDVLALFCSYDWPGNVRELEHSIERAANIALSGELTTEYFENIVLRVALKTSGPVKGKGLCLAKEKAERKAIIAALTQTKGNVTKASEMLNIHRTVLYNKLKKYNIDINRGIAF